MAAIGGFRSDLSITRKTDGNFGNVSAGVLFPKFQSRVSTKTELTTNFDRYTVTLKIRTPNRRMRLARHIGFVSYFKLAQTCILRYYSTFCKTNGKEK